MNTVRAPQAADPAFTYHLLRAALEVFGRRPGELRGEDRRQAQLRARRSIELESRVLASPEAQGVVVPREQVEEAVAQVAARYGDRSEFLADLHANGLTEADLSAALQRELRFDAVMRRVAAASPAVSETDVALFYELHPERFQRPERRVARHILVTINSAIPENRRALARARIDEAHEALAGDPGRFPDVARRYSECPTALEGGRLGEVTRGQLYPSLEAVLFALHEGEVSEVVESELGFHVLCCEAILPSRTISYEEAAPRIREALQRRLQGQRQKAWLANLEPTSPP